MDPSRRERHAVQLAFALAVLASPSLSTAQQEREDAALQATRVAVARALARPVAGVSFEGLKFVRDKLGEIVCGMANGKRFLAGPTGKPPPQLEADLNPAMFNYLWNARCLGMSASAADEAFGREQK